MLWHIQPILVWLISPQGVNTLFALVCLAAALGANARAVALVSAVIYLAVVLNGIT